jgi:hypothetical protein
MRINYRDLFERVGWTAIQAVSGALLDLLISGDVTLRAAGYAAGVALLKVVVAQQVGDRATGDAIPGGVEPEA